MGKLTFFKMQVKEVVHLLLSNLDTPSQQVGHAPCVVSCFMFPAV